MDGAQLRACLEAEVDELHAQGNIDSLIKQHYQYLGQYYKVRPFFYKNVLKFDRFMVVLAMLANYYDEHLPSLSKVRELCLQRGYLSKNSLESYFSFFIISGYMEVTHHPDDRRLRIYRPSVRAMAEAVNIVSAYYFPALGMTDTCDGSAKVSGRTVEAFFRGFKRILDADITLDMLLPESRWLINRDGGHMPMLALFVEALEKQAKAGSGCKRSSYGEMSAGLAVSSTHLIRLVREGETKGYFTTARSTLELSESFMQLVRKMMLINFAITRVSIRLGEQHTGQ
ncbi:hypothetical protein NJC40_25770 [Pseudomonas sp. 21LCFQ02]|uniref:hypothetical protein n=1 Tax=Pseudomonas sp. 21LCFQ02 TaxID=2957505 RepID=UPI00209B8FEC|nr:hypothetical protein [Pseudomonas sp. 21LCFQ02]MCO8171182.1 hypothetical protein [Pseudomonas sp. 21LCFQ02]